MQLSLSDVVIYLYDVPTCSSVPVRCVLTCRRQSWPTSCHWSSSVIVLTTFTTLCCICTATTCRSTSRSTSRRW